MRLIHTEPWNKVIDRLVGEDHDAYQTGQAHAYLVKSADEPVSTQSLSGELFLSRSGWLLLGVPNALVRGTFDALNEKGVELPPNKDGKLNAHITVLRPEELESIGGPAKVTERGHHFHYTLGPIKSVRPAGWEDISRVWFIEVKSKELQDLRKSYGLSALPKEGKHEFHITVAVRRKHVLRDNDIKKAASFLDVLFKKADTPKRKARIVRDDGNTPLYPNEQAEYYANLAAHLQSRGYDSSFDAEDADLWVGHGKDINAPEGSNTFDTSAYAHQKSRIHMATQQQLAKALGFADAHALPESLRTARPIEHYTVTNEMRKALDDKIGYKPVQDRTVDRLERQVDNGKDYKWVGPTTLGAGLAGLGTAAMLAFKEGEAYGSQKEQQIDSTTENKKKPSAWLWTMQKIARDEGEVEEQTTDAGDAGDAARDATGVIDEIEYGGGARRESHEKEVETDSAETSQEVPAGSVHDTADVHEARRMISVPDVPQEDDFDCGPATLKAIYAYYGINEDALDELGREMNTTEDGGTTPEAIEAEAKKHGLKVVSSTMTIDDLKQHIDAKRPVIVPYQAHGGGHYSTVVGYDDDYLYLRDPSVSGDPTAIAFDEFESRWHDEDKNGKKFNNFGIAIWPDEYPTKSATLNNGKFEGSDLYEVPADLAQKGYTKAKNSVGAVYGKLEKRYGPTMAKTIIASGLIGAPIPGPGTSLLTAAPFLAAGEVMHAVKGDYVPPKDEAERLQRQEKRNKTLKLLGSVLGPMAGAGAAAYALHKPTNTQVPSQVTKFPGQKEPWVIRGRVAHDAPASTIENTGDAYVYVGPKNYWRTHGVPNDPESLGELLRSKLKPEQRLGLLEFQGHGTYADQRIGDSTGPRGDRTDSFRGDPDKSINPKTVDRVVKEFKSVPWSEKDPTFINYGCHTGLCDPPPGGKPQNDWMQYLSDNTGVTGYGARGYVGSEFGSGIHQNIHSTGRGAMNSPHPGNLYSHPAEDYAWTRYRPNKSPDKVVDSDADHDTKQTYQAFPNNKLFNALYSVGKPSAIAGALAAPLISNKTYARNTAIATSALAAPMVLSEILTRFGEASGKNELGTGNGLMTHLRSQSKALPYAALAGLPLLSYGAANLLGRWKKDKEKPEKVVS